MEHALANVLGFGPSMVDVCVPLDPAQYQASHELLGVDPGGWRLIEDSSTVDQLLQIVGAEGASLGLVGHAPGLSVAAGSSILGMLGAMPPHIREKSVLATTLATREGQVDAWSAYFVKSLGHTGITHHATLVEGRNPLGFVLYPEGEGGGTEKTLAMHPGVAQAMSEYERLEEVDADLILIDAYELKDGQLSGLLDQIITSGEYQVALSLGNHTLLESGLHARVRKYIDDGHILAVCGNEQEYQVTFPELDPAQTSREEFPDHPVSQKVPYVLMTRAENGMDSFWEGKHVRTKAHPIVPEAIVNTSGAGDTVMGAFCGGVISGDDPGDTMAKAAYLASEVLSIPSSMILARR
jgi:sugar/nucleoside kinase (ribokinase family)